MGFIDAIDGVLAKVFDKCDEIEDKVSDKFDALCEKYEIEDKAERIREKIDTSADGMKESTKLYIEGTAKAAVVMGKAVICGRSSPMARTASRMQAKEIDEIFARAKEAREREKAQEGK